MTVLSARDGHFKSTALVSALLAALCALAAGPSYVNHDAAWYLYVVRRLWDGATLYRDVIDTNPPLIVWASAPPVLAGWLTGISVAAAFKTYVFAFAAAALLVVDAIVRRTWRDHRFLLVTGAAFVTLPFVKTDFGQREHFAVLLTLPYVVAAAARPVALPTVLRVVVGVAAGLGFAIKPHFAAAWLGVELLAWRREGRSAFRRTELLAAAAACAAYAAALLLLTPEYLAVADQVRRVYGGLDSPSAVLLRLREVQLWLVAAALLVAVRWPATARLPPTLFAAATGYLIGALLQFKGWGYQLYPARAFTVLFLIAAVAVLLDVVPGVLSVLRGGRRGLAAVFAGAMVVASMRYVAEARRPAAPDLVAPLIAAIAAHAPEGPLTVLSMRTIIYPAFPAVNYTSTSWGLRHNALWFLPGFYRDQVVSGVGPLEAHAPDRMVPLERLFFDQIIEDLCRFPPRLLAVERAASAAPAGRRALDLQAYYSQDPRARRLFDGYQPAQPVGPFMLMTSSGTASCD